MKKAVIVKPLALDNIQKAYLWYEDQLQGLGEEFLDEWESIANHISIHSESYSKKYKSFRQALLKRFPFVVVYEVEGNNIVVYNVINMKRSLKKRFKKK
jgi:hypothetical protein